MMEAVISTLLVGGVLAATIQLVGPTARGSLVAANEIVAQSLAAELLAEIAPQPYADPTDDKGAIGPDAGEGGPTRMNFDDVDDYDGWAGNVVDMHGNKRDGLYGAWTRKVTVQFVNATDTTKPSVTDAGVKRVTVVVTHDGTTLATRSIIRTTWRRPAAT